MGVKNPYPPQPVLWKTAETWFMNSENQGQLLWSSKNQKWGIGNSGWGWPWPFGDMTSNQLLAKLSNVPHNSVANRRWQFGSPSYWHIWGLGNFDLKLGHWLNNVSINYSLKPFIEKLYFRKFWGSLENMQSSLNNINNNRPNNPSSKADCTFTTTYVVNILPHGGKY